MSGAPTPMRSVGSLARGDSGSTRNGRGDSSSTRGFTLGSMKRNTETNRKFNGMKFDHLHEVPRPRNSYSQQSQTSTAESVMSSGPQANGTKPSHNQGERFTSPRVQRRSGSALARRLRPILHGKYFSRLMVVAVFIALFLPDICVLQEVDTDLEQDVLMSMVTMLFIIELIVLPVVDPAYLWSLFFVVDALGTASMALDISFLAKSVAGGAKICVRALRLSRVLRVLRLWPFLTHGKEKQFRGMSAVISAQLANSVATHVAKLTVLLAVAVPLFGTVSFPQSDYALEAWVNRLSEMHVRKKLSVFHTELGEMVEFFSRHSYGPFKACHGYTSESGFFVCEQAVSSWKPTVSEPLGMSSALMVHSDTFMVAFNMHHNARVEALVGIASIVFVILCMVCSGLTLTGVVSDLVVRPLERMLVTVRQIASTVFKFTQEINKSDEEVGEAGDPDVDLMSEMQLLEKVVHKLAIIADLQTRNGMHSTEDMQDEDIGILSMMQGENIVEKHSRPEQRSLRTPSSERSSKKKRRTSVMKLEDFGISEENFASWNFNAIPLSKSQKTTLAIYTISRFHDPGEGFVRDSEEEQTLERFISTVEKEYRQNPFHNFAHAVDVSHVIARLLRLMHSEGYLTELEQFALLIAGIAHDVGHPGVNNGFLSEVGHEVALMYNDRSCLENMHCAKLYSIVGNTETNVFSKMTREQYKEARKYCIETILHTDMMSHQAMVTDLQMVYQMNLEVFNSNPNNISSSGAPGPSAAELEVFAQNDVKVIVMNHVLHSADVSNPCRAWDVTQAWAYCVLDEYFAQGDQEKSLGIPVQFLNDRDKLNKPNSQIGFIEFMIAPLFSAVVRIWPELYEFGDNLVNNNSNWEDMWVKEVSPAEEERQKARGRVERVKETMDDAKLRGAPKTHS